MNGEESKTLKSPALVIDLQGQAEHIVYRNAENGYTVLRIRVRGYPDPVTAVGIAAEPAPGEMLTMKGRWEENSRYGMQFRFDTLDSRRSRKIPRLRPHTRHRPRDGAQDN